MCETWFLLNYSTNMLKTKGHTRPHEKSCCLLQGTSCLHAESVPIDGNFSSEISESGVLLPLRSLYVSLRKRQMSKPSSAELQCESYWAYRGESRQPLSK